ncbi:histidine phosphatase family protein [Paracoccaceae bacterium]|nr:histidine phosphatase family protein [Paracoccaceae bacterium]
MNVPALVLGNVKLQRILTCIIFSILLFRTDAHARSELETISNSISANVIFLRHALAPGLGDPENFIKKDCSTQRNLNNKGRLQARLIGNYLRSTNLKFSQILTSEWCRCIDTAKELNIGQWTTFSGLNSFYQQYEKKDQVMSKLQKKLDSLSFSDLVLFVTHQVVIAEQTGVLPKSGEMVLYNSITKQKARYMVGY